MGSLTISVDSAVAMFVEFVGYKAGLNLSEQELCDLLVDFDEDLVSKISKRSVGAFRFHSSEIDELLAHLLFKVGNITDPSTIPPQIRLFHKVKTDPELLACYEFVMGAYTEFIRSILAAPPPADTALNPEPFMRTAMEEYGRDGLEMAMEVIKGVNHQLHISPYSRVRSFEWEDAVELQSLFKSESLEPMYGRFFDQRFIDYLERNFERIGDIHWRKFEGLAGEYFDREGFRVDVGPGRNDDGIDLRIYPKEAAENMPPLIIVQCKRQKEKIGKTLLKSVYADVLFEKAESGLIVTSSTISPGAETMRVARNYPVETADRDTLKAWIGRIKTENC